MSSGTHCHGPTFLYPSSRYSFSGACLGSHSCFSRSHSFLGYGMSELDMLLTRRQRRPLAKCPCSGALSLSICILINSDCRSLQLSLWSLPEGACLSMRGGIRECTRARRSRSAAALEPQNPSKILRLINTQRGEAFIFNVSIPSLK